MGLRFQKLQRQYPDLQLEVALFSIHRSSMTLGALNYTARDRHINEEKTLHQGSCTPVFVDDYQHERNIIHANTEDIFSRTTAVPPDPLSQPLLAGAPPLAVAFHLCELAWDGAGSGDDALGIEVVVVLRNIPGDDAPGIEFVAVQGTGVVDVPRVEFVVMHEAVAADSLEIDVDVVLAAKG